jgi:hypothetical protein
MSRYIFCTFIIFIFLTKFSFSQSSNLDSGYYYLNQGNKKLATQIFENYLKENPKDTKIHMQLGYIYYDQRKLAKSLKHFDYVGRHSTNPSDVEKSRSAALIIRDELASTAKRSIDLYFYNFYDSYQDNYIANIVGHYNFRIAPQFYTGFYLDLYTDTRSKPELIFNDRYVELGGFLRYNLLSNLFLEFRVGYTREIDLDTSRINIKPMLVYFNRLGDAKVYVNRRSSSKTSLYLNMYYAAMYDYKFKNAFIQSAFQEVLRFGISGYSYMENYLVQYAQFDSRKLDYNNYVEVGTGIRYHANVPYFPVLFVEPTYKVYFFGDRKNSFQLKVGFEFIFRTPL